jgi:hypothetical protein
MPTIIGAKLEKEHDKKKIVNHFFHFSLYSRVLSVNLWAKLARLCVMTISKIEKIKLNII